MRINRRDFLATSAIGAALSTMAPRKAHAQPTRSLSITFHGLAVFAIGRPSHVVGMPAQSPRVDVLFVPHPDHYSPALYFGAPKPIDIGNSDLQILVGDQLLSPVPSEVSIPGNPLFPAFVELRNSAVDVCPINGLEWENLSRIPEFEEVLQTQVTVKKGSWGAIPAGVNGRFTMRTGVFGGDVPRAPYLGQAWKFPGGNINYIRAFTDTAMWSVPLPDNTPITARTVKFGATVPTTSVSLGSTGDIDLYLRSGAKTAVPNQTTIAHFAHYYGLLDYSSTVTPKPTPIPTLVPDLCKEVTPTAWQLRRQTLLQQYLTIAGLPQQDCGGEELELRGEPNICENGIAYADFR